LHPVSINAEAITSTHNAQGVTRQVFIERIGEYSPYMAIILFFRAPYSHHARLFDHVLMDVLITLCSITLIALSGEYGRDWA